MGRNPRFLNSGEQGKGFYRELWNTILAGGIWTGRFTNRKKDGTLYTPRARSPRFTMRPETSPDS